MLNINNKVNYEINIKRKEKNTAGLLYLLGYI